jgi:hypothetical protein
MTATGARALKLATRMIAKEGGLCVLSRITRGTFNPVTQLRTPDVVSTVAVPMVRKDYVPLAGIGAGESMVPGTKLLAEGVAFTLSAEGLPWAPQPEDTITDPYGVIFPVQNVRAVGADSNAVVYTCACSR